MTEFKRDQVQPIWHYLRTYRCVCGWNGNEPTVTDTSQPHPQGGTVHLCLCPRCGEPV